MQGKRITSSSSDQTSTNSFNWEKSDARTSKVKKSRAKQYKGAELYVF